MERNIEILSRIKVGDRITADMLNAITLAINRNTQGVASPKQVEADNSATSDVNYSETSRSVLVVQVFDQNDENYADIERIESISFRSDGGDTITLSFNNLAAE